MFFFFLLLLSQFFKYAYSVIAGPDRSQWSYLPSSTFTTLRSLEMNQSKSALQPSGSFPCGNEPGFAELESGSQLAVSRLPIACRFEQGLEDLFADSEAIFRKFPSKSANTAVSC
jgi:hypothetical protein